MTGLSESFILDREETLKKMLQEAMAEIASCESWQKGLPEVPEENKTNDWLVSRQLYCSKIQKASEIVEALKRISLGTFGICSQCQGNIPEERLDLVPEKPMCCSCSEKKTNRR